MKPIDLIKRKMGEDVVIKTYEIPIDKDSKNRATLAFAHTENAWFEKSELEYLAKLDASKPSELYRFDIAAFEKNFKHHTHMVYVTRLNCVSEHAIMDALLTQVERNWSHGRRIFLTDTVGAWLKGYKVHQELIEDTLGRTCVVMVVPEDFHLDNAVLRELDYLRRVDSADTAERISKLMRKHGAIAVNFVRGETPNNMLLLSEEVRNWAMACSA